MLVQNNLMLYYVFCTDSKKYRHITDRNTIESNNFLLKAILAVSLISCCSFLNLQPISSSQLVSVELRHQYGISEVSQMSAWREVTMVCNDYAFILLSLIWYILFCLVYLRDRLECSWVFPALFGYILYFSAMASLCFFRSFCSLAFCSNSSLLASLRSWSLQE